MYVSTMGYATDTYHLHRFWQYCAELLDLAQSNGFHGWAAQPTKPHVES